MKIKKLPPIEVLQELLTYCPESGELRWKESRKRCKAGDVAGWGKDGYIIVTISQRYYAAHRLAWALYYGEDPELYIDHKNGDRSDNRISNLRLATSSENNHNATRRHNNTSGHRGVSYNKLRNKWEARIHINGKHVWCGSYECKEDAINARLKAEAENNIYVCAR